MMHTSEMETYWWKNAKIYELYIDKFAKNVQGLTAQLPYFEALGINCLHILPHYPSPMVDDGYDVSDYRNVRHELGTLKDFEELVREAHARGIRILTDFVLNHTSSLHPWFVEARSSTDNPKRDYYLWSTTGTEFAKVNSGIADIKDNNWIRNDATGDYYFAKYYPQQPDLNWDNPEVFDEMLSIMEFWADIGVDGFRLDAAPYLIKREGTESRGLPETHALIKRIRARLESKYPNVIMMAEANQSVADTKQYFGNGDECHMAYHFTLMMHMWLAIKQGDMLTVQQIVDESAGIPENCQWAIFLRNHDELTLTRFEPDIRDALVAFLDPDGLFHFKKGQSTSMRMASIFRGNRAGMRKAFELLYSLPGAPIMYYGDEIGMANLPHEESVLDSRKYVRGEFDWSLAESQMADPSSLWNEVAALIKGLPRDNAKDSTEVEPLHAMQSV